MFILALLLVENYIRLPCFNTTDLTENSAQKQISIGALVSCGWARQTAQALGKNDSREIGLLLARTLLIALVGGIALIVFQQLIAEISFALIDATPEVEKYARQYFHIRIYAAPATLALYALHGCLHLPRLL